MQYTFTNLEKPWESVKVSVRDLYFIVMGFYDKPYQNYSLGYYDGHYIEEVRFEHGILLERKRY